MPTRHVGCTPPRVGVCPRTRAPPHRPPLCFSCLLVRYSWLTAPVGCGCRRPVMRRSTSCMTWRSMWLCDIVRDVVGTKRRGRDGAPSTMLWQVELASVGELQVER